MSECHILALQVTRRSLPVDMGQQLLVLQREVEDSSQALASLHDVINSGSELELKQNDRQQAKYFAFFAVPQIAARAHARLVSVCMRLPNMLKTQDGIV